MKHVTLFVLTAAVASAVPAAAAAGTPRTVGHHKTAVTRLRHELRAEQTRLARKNTALEQAKTELAAASVQAAQLQSQVSETATGLAAADASLASTQQQLTASEGQVSALQTQIAAVPAPLAVAEEQVRREVSYQEKNNQLPFSDGRLVSQAAMGYVVGHVDASAYGYLEVFGLPLPLATPDSILGLQAGICGHAALTFAAIVKSFGFQVRSVQFYYTDPSGPAGPGAPDSHIADEVYYDGSWHFFDPTFGAYWTDGAGSVLDITTVRSTGGTEVKDEASFTNLAENYFYGDSTAFETDPAANVVLDGQAFSG